MLLLSDPELPSVIDFNSVAIAEEILASILVVKSLLFRAAEASPESSSMMVTVISSLPSLALPTESLSMAKLTLNLQIIIESQDDVVFSKMY